METSTYWSQYGGDPGITEIKKITGKEEQVMGSRTEECEVQQGSITGLLK